MKKLLFLKFILIFKFNLAIQLNDNNSNLILSELEEQNLISAIDHNNLKNVALILKNNPNFSKKQKKKLLKISQTAIKIYLHDTTQLKKSSIDIIRFFVGSYLTLCSLPLLAAPISAIVVSLKELSKNNSHFNQRLHNKNTFNKKKFVMQILVSSSVLCSIGCLTAWLGINQTRKGWNLYTAHNRVKKARIIYNLLKKHAKEKTN